MDGSAWPQAALGLLAARTLAVDAMPPLVWWDALATLATALTCAVALWHLWILPQAPPDAQIRSLWTLLAGITLLAGVMAGVDTLIVHLPPEWPAWPRVRRIVWRHYALCLQTHAFAQCWWGIRAAQRARRAEHG